MPKVRDLDDVTPARALAIEAALSLGAPSGRVFQQGRPAVGAIS
jgi:hypothetical protein